MKRSSGWVTGQVVGKSDRLRPSRWHRHLYRHNAIFYGCGSSTRVKGIKYKQPSTRPQLIHVKRVFSSANNCALSVHHSALAGICHRPDQPAMWSVERLRSVRLSEVIRGSWGSWATFAMFPSISILCSTMQSETSAQSTKRKSHELYILRNIPSCCW